tara:strand:+ start:117 stop:503 length:387 start_codon:yes stop_codon:yes gene_type:complete
MNRKDKTVKQLQAECKKRKIGFMTSWTKLALIKRLEDEDKREKSLNELKKEVKDKSKKLESLDPKVVQQNAIKTLAAAKRNELARIEKEWDVLTKKQDAHYNEAARIGDRKKILHDQKRNLEVFLESL